MFKSLFGSSKTQPNSPASDTSNNIQLQRQVILMALSTLERAAKKIPSSSPASPIIISDCSRTISNDAARVLVRGVRANHPKSTIHLYRTYEEDMETDANTIVS